MLILEISEERERDTNSLKKILSENIPSLGREIDSKIYEVHC
jgi:hypothetical protein